jgi:hypothetical protein
MHLGKFHRAIYLLLSEYEQNQIETKFRGVITALQSISANPTSSEIAATFGSYLQTLHAALVESSLNRPHPTLAAMLYSIKAEPYIGEKLYQRVENVLNFSHMTPQVAAAELELLFAEVVIFYARVSAINDAFSHLEVEYDKLLPGEGEIGISIPKPPGDRFLSDLAETAKAWDKALKPFVELVDPHHDKIVVRTISSSDWQFYLTAAPEVLFQVSVVISLVNNILRKLVDSKRIIAELIGKGFTSASTEPIDSEAKSQYNSEAREFAEKLVNESNLEDQARANELKISITRSVKFIAGEMAKNVTVEVRYIAPKSAEKDGASEEEKESEIRRIEMLSEQAAQIERNMDLVRLDPQSRELLTLPAPDDEVENEIKAKI